jgi:iron complex outermembrane receptor protein
LDRTTRPVRVAIALSVASATFASHAGERTNVAPEIVVTATRFDENVRDLPVNATVISAEDIARSPARTLPQLLSSHAGIGLRDLFGTNTVSSTLDMRGFGAAAGQNTLILLDGRRLNDIDLSGLQWSTVPLEQIDRIEILRGSGAVQYGAGATAGVINIVTRQPRANERSLNAGVRVGGWGTTEVHAAGTWSGNAAGISATARNHESEGYRVNSHNREASLLASGRWQVEAADLGVRFSADRQGTRLPGARRVQPSAGVDQLATDRRGTSTPLDYAQRDGTRLDADLRVPFGAGEFILGAGRRDKTQRSYFDFSGFPDYRAIDLDVTTVNPRLRFGFDALGTKHSLVTGVDLARWSYRLRRSNSEANVARPFTTVEARQTNSGFYAIDTIRATDRLTFQVGARAERQRISANDTHDAAAPGGAFGAAAPAGNDHRTQHAAEAGARMQFIPDVAGTLKAVRSFRFATVDETYETSPTFVPEFQFLRPQTARSLEAGVELGSGTPFLRASLFRIDLRDEIHLDPFSTGVGNTNLPPSRREGIEIEGRHRPAAGLTLTAAYTYTRARFLEGTLPGGAFTTTNVQIGGKTVPLVPQHRLQVGAAYAAGENTLATATVRYESSQIMENDEGNTLGARIPEYAVTDVKLSHRMGNLRITAGIENLFNRKYYTYAVRSQFVPDRYNAYPLPERAFMLGLEIGGL